MANRPLPFMAWYQSQRMGQPSRPLVRPIASSSRADIEHLPRRSLAKTAWILNLFASMHDMFRIRRATVEDVEIIAWHRARMFQDMGDVCNDAFEILRAKARLRVKEWLESGDYIGWLATLADKTETVVGGAGVQLQPILFFMGFFEPIDA